MTRLKKTFSWLQGRGSKQIVVLLLLSFCCHLLFPAPCGDVNSDGAINVVDALMTAQYYVGLTPPGFDQAAADVSGDGVINIVDALQIAQYYVGLISSFQGCASVTDPPPTPTINPNLPAGPEGYVYCAGEGETVTFDTLVDVAFGTDGSFNYQYGVTGAVTFNNSTFGDPIYGKVKYGFCKYLGPTSIPTLPPTPTATPAGWTPEPIPAVVEGGEPIGMAVYPDDGVESTTGGGDGEVVTARTRDQLADYAGRSEPMYIIVEGSLSGGLVEINSDKTIIGAGDGARLSGIQLNVNGKKNIIIRNLYISGATDAIATRGTSHVWIDHCDVSKCGDGLIDITKESDYHTVSWTRFSNHHKTMLLNSGTSQPADADDLNTTLHHNWWDGSDTRNPRAAYGDIHVFNNLYNNNDYCIGLHSQCMVLSENNYFKDTNDPIHQMYRMDPTDIHHGFCKDVGSIFDNTSGDMHNEDDLMTVNFSEQYYMYNFALDPAADVPAIVKAKVGPGSAYNTLGPLPVPGNGAIKVSTNPTLRWTRGHSATSYQVAFGTTSPPPVVTTTTGQTYSPGSLQARTIYYWRVDQVNSNETVTGNVWCFRTQ